jgi:hypothetical protein
MRTVGVLVYSALFVLVIVGSQDAFPANQSWYQSADGVASIVILEAFARLFRL